jgi:hypothetical protein
MALTPKFTSHFECHCLQTQENHDTDKANTHLLIKSKKQVLSFGALLLLT